jgi:hypothetical protein
MTRVALLLAFCCLGPFAAGRANGPVHVALPAAPAAGSVEAAAVLTSVPQHPAEARLDRDSAIEDEREEDTSDDGAVEHVQLTALNGWPSTAGAERFVREGGAPATPRSAAPPLRLRS